MVDAPSITSQAQGTAGGTDIVTALQGITRQITNGNKALIDAMTALTAAITAALPKVTGSFTLAASATTVVTQPAIKANSIVTLTPTNAAAGTLMGSAKSLYHSANTAGASFTVATASAAAAAGTETVQLRSYPAVGGVKWTGRSGWLFPTRRGRRCGPAIVKRCAASPSKTRSGGVR